MADTQDSGIDRVKQEAKDLYSQALIGTLLRTFAAAFRDASLICLVIVGLDAFLKFTFEEGASASCFTLAAENCSLAAGSVILRLAVVAGICYWGGFLSTKFRARSKFQHSALVSTMIILALTAALAATPLPLPLTAFFAATVFISSYQGYRRYFRHCS